MRIKLMFLFVLFSLFATMHGGVFASSSNGTIDGTYRYAWGENIGFVDFGSTAGNVHVTDSALSGSAYGENIGWIDLSSVTNNNEGGLSGYAWGENIGFVDFSNVDIGTDGVFSGGAYGENIGWITFGTGDNKVATDWRPVSSRGGSSSGSTARSRVNNLINNSNPVLAQQVAQQYNVDLPNSSSSNPAPAVSLVTCSIVRTLAQGSVGPEVKCLQENLNFLTKSNLSTDSIFGPKTKAAVILFQTQNNLVPDGIVGPKTKQKFYEKIT